MRSNVLMMHMIEKYRYYYLLFVQYNMLLYIRYIVVTEINY